MAKLNKYGLSRSIPADVRRKVRQQSGYGCVICGMGVIQYEHVDPEFHEAKFHDPSAITLLCPSCHSKVTTNFYSKQKVLKAMMSPAAKRAGFTKDFFDFCGPHPSIKIGGMKLIRCHSPVIIYDRPILKIEGPKEPGAPFLLSGIFCDEYGQPTLEIVENEWRANSESWDVEVSAGEITVRDSPRNVVLRLKVIPPHTILVERLKMRFGFVEINISGESINLKSPMSDLTLSDCLAEDCKVGISMYSLKRPPAVEHYSLITRLIRHAYSIDG